MRTAHGERILSVSGARSNVWSFSARLLLHVIGSNYTMLFKSYEHFH